MDKVIIRDLKIDAIVGLYPWERVARQTVWLDIDLGTDIRQAAKNNDLQYAIDYSAVCESVEVMLQEQQYYLLETLAENVVAMIRKTFNVRQVKLAVFKEDVLTQVRRVGIEIVRGED